MSESSTQDWRFSLLASLCRKSGTIKSNELADLLDRLQLGDDAGKTLTITLPDTSSKAFWSGSGKTEVFHPETYKRWVKEAIERYCAIAGIEVRVK